MSSIIAKAGGTEAGDRENGQAKRAPRAKADQSERNAVHLAYEWIKSQILSGRFKAGETLPQGTLAKHCNTSRGPIREALRMLQNQGLIEAETNQRGRVASFTPRDLELMIASSIVVAAAAIARHDSAWPPAETKKIEKLIDEIESLSREPAATVEARRELIGRRQHVYRSMVLELCAQGGAPVQQILAGHFDRITIFRQMGSIRLGDEPEFPLSADMDDLRMALRAGDTRGVAFAIVDRMATLGRHGLDDMGEFHMGGEIAASVTFVRNALAATPQISAPKQIRTSTSQKVWVELKGNETLIWNFSDD